MRATLYSNTYTVRAGRLIQCCIGDPLLMTTLGCDINTTYTHTHTHLIPSDWGVSSMNSRVPGVASGGLSDEGV